MVSTREGALFLPLSLLLICPLSNRSCALNSVMKGVTHLPEVSDSELVNRETFQIQVF